MKKPGILKHMKNMICAALILALMPVNAYARTYLPYGDNSSHWNTINAYFAVENGCLGQDLDTDYDMGGDGNYEDPIVVAVIDSGICPDHPDLDYTHVIDGACFTGEGTSTVDQYGHGTFIAGEIIASPNGFGVDGLATEAYIMPLKAFDAKSASIFAVAEALEYAADQRILYDETNGTEGVNVCVVNMSLAKKEYSNGLSAAVEKAIDAGIIVISACGNYGDESGSYPAQDSIGVGVVDMDGGLDSYGGSKTGILSEANGEGFRNKVWVTAPGEKYGSLWYNGGYYTQSGTSFASAQVAALAAIAVGMCNDLTRCVPGGAKVDDGSGTMVKITNNHLAFKYLLQHTANLTDYNTGLSSFAGMYDHYDGQDPFYGWGVVDYKAMIEAIDEGYIPGQTYEEPEEGEPEPKVEPEHAEDPEMTENPVITPEAPVIEPVIEPAPTKFADVPENAYYAIPVAWALEKGVTGGTDSTHFSPDRACTRAQMVTLLWKACGCPEPASSRCSFTDVSENAYYRKAVMWAVEKGITAGTGKNSFSPDNNVTRAQAVTFLAKMAGATEEAAMIPHGFTDVPDDAYYKAAVSWAKLNGITGGTGNGRFSPDMDCSRAQIITFLYKFFNE